MFSFDEIVEKIVAEKQMERAELEKLIEEKQDELSGLVSREGAAYIVGRELGIDLIKEGKRDLKIKNIVPGMRNSELVVKIVRIFEKRLFDKDGKKGQVLTMIVGDETGTTRLTFWNDQLDLIGKLGLDEGDAIQITNAWIKEGLNGPEISLGKNGSVSRAEKTIEIKTTSKNIVYKKMEIADLEENSFVEVKGCLVNVFNRDPLYATCPDCNGKVEKNDDKFGCPVHGEVEPKYNLILSGVLDDGTENIKIVFFKELAEKVFGKKTEELQRKRIDDIYKEFQGLGKDLIVKGKVRKNSYSGEKEFIAAEVDSVDVKKECEKLLEELKG